MHFGATLQLLRSHSGLSLRALAGRVGVSAAYVSRVEHGHDPPPTGERAHEIARALGLPESLVASLVDEVRGDAADWLRSTPTGRRLAAELRRRELGEAQLARVLAFVQREFPEDRVGKSCGLRPLVASSRVLLRVRLSRLDDARTLAALRLWDRDGGPGAPGRDEPAVTSCVGAATAISFSRGARTAPVVSLVVCEAPVDASTPDGRPVRVVWVLTGVADGAPGAQLLANAARLADDALVRRLTAATTEEEALHHLDRFERLGVV